MVVDGRGGLVHLSVGQYKRQWAPRGAALPCWATSLFAPFATVHTDCLPMAWRRASRRSAAVARCNASASSPLRVQWAGDCVGLVPLLRGGAPSGRRHCLRPRLTIPQALYTSACAIGRTSSALHPTTIDRVPGAVRGDTASLYGRAQLPNIFNGLITALPSLVAGTWQACAQVHLLSTGLLFCLITAASHDGDPRERQPLVAPCAAVSTGALLRRKRLWSSPFRGRSRYSRRWSGPRRRFFTPSYEC